MILAAILALSPAIAAPRLVPTEQVEGATESFRGRRIALLIGPSAWADPAFPALRYADDDAIALAGALADPLRGHFDQLWTLTRPEDTTLAAVEATLRAVEAAARSPNDTIVVYVSTHGTLARDPSGRLAPWLVLSDTRLSQVTSTGLSQARLLEWLDGLPSRKRVAIFATCHAGQGKSVLSSEVRAQLASTKGAPIVPLREVSEATVVIGVCAMAETALESDTLGHDVYTWYLLDALAKGDTNDDGAVTLTEAHEFARQGAYTFTGGSQRAWAHAEVLGEDPIVLAGARSRTGAAQVGSYRDALDGYRINVDGVQKGVLPGEVTLESGPHRVELVSPHDGQVVARQRVNLDRGQRVDVEALLGRDRVRMAVGLGGAAFGIGPENGVIGTAEVDLPRALPGGWELVGLGGATFRWPDPTLTGSLIAEHPLFPGPVQLRVGAGLQAWLLQNQAAELVAPSLSPVPWVSVTHLPVGPVFSRLWISGGWLWYTDRGALHSGWTVQMGLNLGVGG